MNKRILLKPCSGKTFLNNQVYRCEGTSSLFYNFDQLLKQESIQIDTFDKKKKEEAVDLILCVDIPYPWQLREWWFLLTTKCEKKILLAIEAPIINPFNYYPFFYWLFNKVYTWNENRANNQKIKLLHYSYNDNVAFEFSSKKFIDKKLLSFISGNKNAPWLFHWLSLSKKNLYKDRLKAAIFFEENYPDDFDFYGRGWNPSKKNRNFYKSYCKRFFKTYKGTVENKLSTLSNYKFNLCFENTIVKNCISEKIFDCFKAGCVPIYLGAPNITDHIPKSAFIDFRNFSSYQKLYEFIANMNEKTHLSYIKAGQNFMNSQERRENWSNKNLLKTIIELVK